MVNERDSKPGSTLRARAIAVATDLAQSSARDIAYIVFRRKAVIIGVFLLVVMATLAYIIVTPYTFESTAQLLIRPGRESIAMDTALVEDQGRITTQNNEELVNTAVAILNSPTLAEQVVDALGADAFLSDDMEELEDADTFVEQLKTVLRYVRRAPRQLVASLKPDEERVMPQEERYEAARKLRSAMNVQPGRRTNVVNVSFMADAPDHAQQTLDKIVDVFLTRHIEVHSPKTSLPFFEERLVALEDMVTKRQQARDAYLAEHGIATVETQKDAMLTQINNAEVNRRTVSSEISASQAKINALEAALANRPETIVTSETEGMQNPIAEKLKATLADLRLEETDMAARYADSYRPLVELRQQITQVEDMLAQEQESSRTITTALDSGYQEIKLTLDMEKAQLESLRVRETMLEADVQAWRDKMRVLTNQANELARLERELNAAEREYTSYQDGFLRAKTALELDMDRVSNVSIIQPATYSRMPAAPNIIRILALGLFLGVFGGVGLAFALEYVDSKVYTREDIERHVSAPVLTVVSEKEFRRLPALIRTNGLPANHEKVDARAKALIPLDSQMPELSRSIAEKMFSLSRRISVLMDHSTAGMSLIFSDVQTPRDGSKLVREYAHLMAMQGRRVLLLALGPLDYPAPSSDLPTDMQWQESMNDGMEVDSMIRQADHSSLYFTQIGQTKGALQALAASPQFDALVWKIRSKFDVVLLDCPPLTDSAVATRLAQLADGAIMTVNAGTTRWQVIQNHVREFQANQGRVFGVILNKRKYYIPNIIYRFF